GGSPPRGPPPRAVCRRGSATRRVGADPPLDGGSRLATGAAQPAASAAAARSPATRVVDPTSSGTVYRSESWEDPMANGRGLIAKARRDELSEGLRSMLGRWDRNAYEDDNTFLTMARRPALPEATWGFIRYIYGGGSSVEPELFELVRVKLAWNNQCVH